MRSTTCLCVAPSTLTLFTSRILSPFLIPAFSAAPPSNTALTCCKGAYNSPFILLNCPPSLTWPLTLKPKPVSVL
uniref:Uncharacterized protein n=1 Tax=Panstrongylus lignarius TaxID=156445 RepID=A0A224XTK6_9HEMI